ncbi:MAG: hypothetical protein Ct9H90mP22_2290 [Gammaproteobacteria bacterium]|nr:MAG: hypothetical protein Ct9H90mP22_2290 [Gammaproteobacteria bacterium]
MIPGLNLKSLEIEGVESILLTPEKTWEEMKSTKILKRSYL